MESYLTAIRKAINWINTQMLTFDTGYYGIYERIRIDEHCRTNWSRPDCNAEYMRVLYLYQELTGEDYYQLIQNKILKWLERTQDHGLGSAWHGSMPFYLVDGYIHENDTDASVYQNDNGKVLLVMCQLYKRTEDQRLLTIACDLAEYWLKTQQPDGTYGTMDGRNREECRKGPCFSQWLTAGFYLLYSLTADRRYLLSAEKGMAYLIPLILPGGRITTSYEMLKIEDWRPVSSETAIMLLTASIAYQVTEKADYKHKLHMTGAYLLSLQNENGAIVNCHNDSETASLQNNPNLCDLVYTQGFALQALVFAYEVTGEDRYLEAAFRLGDFLVSIQCQGESILWDGGWRGSYNVATKEWDGWANQNNAIDEGGMYSVYTGWCCTNIVYGLELLEKLKANRKT